MSGYSRDELNRMYCDSSVSAEEYNAYKRRLEESERLQETNDYTGDCTRKLDRDHEEEFRKPSKNDDCRIG
ncbi:hypothetical protein TVAG_366440 [Trichomonas vaginalis G3]|uniref:Uncharacterized protein n=1 Tax=Trichomonas vaginalis (strain ATCC PRA-98 / G3) TaxID=412133 RepID=A2DHT8_TRIV3|nr:hypothetical protein TVAGG3_0303590 [Trichomonas vaginalis G3]EAY20136.1 hypothetical protein TVAG_366440 [Trichomonas vaginalis G3]KAI5528088.1 hypothetical protein TVAGG3_0303590 [Trichomonas vaginalis G3]|eukprot:XP_001581122.1 hypothetical protein [Trichomonas vaginalis G3]